MHVAETLYVGSIPGFLGPEDLAEIRAALSDVFGLMHGGVLSAEQRTESVHSVEGLSTLESMRVYEPAGRDELSELPSKAQDVLAQAGERALKTLQISLPSARAMSHWTFVSYTAGQSITPHIDLSNNDPDPEHPKVAGLSICLSDQSEYTGGEFFVETTTDAEQWCQVDGGMPLVRDECDESSEWYRRQRRTRWTARPAAGDALVYGSQLTHGTEPVVSGRVVKIIGFIVS
ncbi:Predicted 2-oxoglutarate-and Fe(II)-dependent dioxygenase YbiX [Lentzea albidocapillata subsp. violacea]|uniref:Predicted 2-oxoglutarate-and Fe(II)-dependent dioxygenase YbiX n=1 Tax=Lentzea albidocapillata subsp. violacea TaxID=128104 RepID=A0A1G9XVL4_9PSEU|nr:phytanoyl-CoA dioxygenase family protein [Lentzea albidocapillata]SDN00466.1 Predicted 2-oxoglutarate-and Fe(II)-dependent dioxygenase YbiX [Lentzea albidocapillata subsp. violacea]